MLMKILFFMSSMLMILNHLKMMMFIFISVELMNLGLLFMFILFNVSFYYLFFILLIQVCDSLLMMILFLKNLPLWENFNNWALI